MTKTSKGNETKTDIIEEALELFEKNGFAQTSLNQIIKATGLSKGGFYHHFSSKEELLEAIAKEQSSHHIENIEKILKHPRLNALKKFNKIIPTLHRAALIKNSKTFVSPLIQELIEQGNSENHFFITSPEYFSEFIIDFFKSIDRALTPFKNEKRTLKKRLRFYQEILENTLNTKSGSIRFTRPLYKWYLSLKD
ncbi:TetR family transcriptional regulator [Candidatus Peregrinibacteria bacterium]|nr:TetR family transcriptional regulator [Candidatus Peregrinibacteria bacterium]